jgi:hypothetical protein
MEYHFTGIVRRIQHLQYFIIRDIIEDFIFLYVIVYVLYTSKQSFVTRWRKLKLLFVFNLMAALRTTLFTCLLRVILERKLPIFLNRLI